MPAGFTLIELMIVVAIIGLLAAIAIPNYLKFQCKAKQAEAKAGLGALFVSEKTFFADHNTYGTDLVSVGWEPEGAPLYLFGFRPGIQYPTTLVGVPWFPTRNNTLEPSVVGSPPRYQTGRTIRLTDSTPLDAASDLPALTACDGGGFVIGAAGDINPDIGSGIDKWFMTQQRELMTQLNDCTSGQ